MTGNLVRPDGMDKATCSLTVPTVLRAKLGNTATKQMRPTYLAIATLAFTVPAVAVRLHRMDLTVSGFLSSLG